ncbi:MAG: AI-2E family transporter [Ignavibacteriales bacterium]|nr:MAG: AI-2E family transporter [Ignavibacteriales bacterium]
MSKKIQTDPVLRFFVIIIGIIAIGFTLKELSHIFLPFIIAYFLFFTFSPINDLLTGKKIPLFIVIIFDIAIIIFLTWGIFSFLIDSFVQFGEELPEYYTRLNRIVRDAARTLGIKDSYFQYFSIKRILSQIDYKVLAGGIFSTTFPLIGSILFILFFFIFIVTGHRGIYDSIKRRYAIKEITPEIKAIRKKAEEDNEQPVVPEIIKEEIHDKEIVLSNTVKAITEQIQRYIIAKILVNLVAGLAVTGILYLLDVDFPIIWGLFAFLFNFIPTIGSAIALILPVIMALIQYESLSFALITAGVLGGVQTIFFNVIEPMVIGKRLNLNPLLILFSVLIWGYLWGIIGMLLSVPLTAVIKIILANSKSMELVFINDLMSKEPEKGDFLPL